MTEQFIGFPREMPDFLFELKLNNTIEKLPENKVKYKKFITEPLTALYNDILPVIDSLNGNFDTKAARCISSKYTDRRFSPQAPLKEYMYLRFKDSGFDTDVLGLYFDMGLEYYSFGLRIYNQTSVGMTAILSIHL